MRYVLIHHGPCAASCHYHIDEAGQRSALKPHDAAHTRKACLEVMMAGDFTEAAPSLAQLAALRARRDATLSWIMIGGALVVSVLLAL